MSLPSICPKPEHGPCSGNTCPMYITDWRSKDEYCMIGYYPPGSRKKLGKPVVDTYASAISGINEGDVAPNRKTVIDTLRKTPAREGENVPDPMKKPSRKSKDYIDLKDIPADYEKQFWR